MIILRRCRDLSNDVVSVSLSPSSSSLEHTDDCRWFPLTCTCGMTIITAVHRLISSNQLVIVGLCSLYSYIHYISLTLLLPTALPSVFMAMTSDPRKPTNPTMMRTTPRAPSSGRTYPWRTQSARMAPGMTRIVPTLQTYSKESLRAVQRLTTNGEWSEST